MFTPQHIILNVKRHAEDLNIALCFDNHEFYSNARKYIYISLRCNSAGGVRRIYIELKIQPTFVIIDYVC